MQNDKKFNELVNDAYEEVREFHRFKRHLLRLKMTCKLAGCTFPLQYDHLAREAEYVMRLFDKMREGRPALKVASQTRENAFWVRIMGDHAKFINHLLDPSERLLIKTACEFGKEFDELYLQSMDFVSMLYYSDNDAPSFSRFLQDVHTSTRQLRDFKRAAQEMISQCKLLGLIPELLADHVRREAEHFLMILTMMEKGIIKNVAGDPECDGVEAIEDFDDSEEDVCLDDNIERPEECEDDDEQEEDERDEKYIDDYKQAKFEQAKIALKDVDDRDEDEDDDREDEDEDEDEDYSPPPPPPPRPQPAPQEKAKYKWGGKWPRPLGK